MKQEGEDNMIFVDKNIPYKSLPLYKQKRVHFFYEIVRVFLFKHQQGLRPSELYEFTKKDVKLTRRQFRYHLTRLVILGFIREQKKSIQDPYKLIFLTPTRPEL